jgi:hypothetical protein
MRTTKVKPGQCLADVAMMAYGSVEGLGVLAGLNGVSPTEPLEVGRTIELPELPVAPVALRNFRTFGTVVAVELTPVDIPRQYVRPGYWEIGYVDEID